MRFFLSPLLRSIFRARRSTVIFQNEADLNKFSDLGFTTTQKSLVIKGSGVDVEYFNDIEQVQPNPLSPKRVLFPSRLIREKGAVELIQAVESLWEEGESFIFSIAGEIDYGNRSALDPIILNRIRNHQNVEVLGHVTNMKKLYRKVDIVILPSWREGLSKALIEAAAMKKAIITTDVPGCRDVVETGESGILVPIRNSVAIKHALKLLLRRTELISLFGNQARKRVEIEFQDVIVNQMTGLLYRKMLNPDETQMFTSGNSKSS